MIDFLDSLPINVTVAPPPFVRRELKLASSQLIHHVMSAVTPKLQTDFHGD